MASITEILQLCRLCLVKEQVNVPIFEEQGDIRQIFLKITACLPVKISREDKLPKKICSGCLYKLELLYQFWNTSTNAEKQLLSWLSAAGMDANTQTTQDAMAVVTQTQVVLKQEPETTENVTVVSDPDNFILQAATQPIEFPAVDFDYQENFSTAEQELANNSINTAAEDSSESEPLAKRARRAATSTVTAPLIESEDDDADDPGEAVAAKTEEDSDDDTNMEPTFVDVAEDQDDEQPGPSGLGKIVEPPMKNSKKASPNRKKGGLQLEVKTMVDKAKIHQGFIKRQRAITKTTHDISLKTSTKKEDFFKCRDCPQVFENKLQLTRHRHYMHSKYAQRQFLSMYTSNEDSTTFTCCKCNNTFDSRKEVETHVQVHLKRYTCPECDEVFLSLKLLVEHSRKHSKENMFHCNECDHKSKYCYLILAHINVKHLKINEIKCTHCDKSFATNAQYRVHFENHHTAIEYKCVVCSKVFQGREGLLQHQRVTHFVSTSNTCCPVCGKRFTNLITLRNHMRDHNSSQLCNVCGKTFRCISLLKFHMRIHTGEKPFKCVSCDKSFRRIQYLRLHTRVHTGEEPFKCEHCGKGFKQQTPLRIHRRIHTGERPFKCIICQKGFVTGTLLKKHQNVCSSK